MNTMGIVWVAFLAVKGIIWTTRNDEIDLETDQLISQGREPLRFLFCVAKLESDVLTLDITERPQLSS